MSILRNPGLVIVTVLVGATMAARGQTPSFSAQFHLSSSSPPARGSKVSAYPDLPEAPGEPHGSQMESQEIKNNQNDPFEGDITGTVLDPSGGEVVGAHVTLENIASKARREMTANGEGFFDFDAVGAGVFKLTISSAGFSTWVSDDIVLKSGQSYDVPQITLQITLATTDVEVVFSQHDIAEEQMKAEEKQRVLGIIPNFYVSYNWKAAPLSSGQKFRLAFRNAIDPVSFLGAAFSAGLEQWQNDYRGYGEGAKGYFSRMGASYGDGFTGAFIGGAILPSVLHQDPRYFYKGTGSIRSRALYAISTAVICRGDNGRWQPNYSNVLGNFISGAISNSYYPPANRGVQLTIDNALIDTASDAVGALFQEFLIKKISRGVHP